MPINPSVQTLEALSFTTILCNVVFTVHQLGRHGPTFNNWGNAIAQMICMVWVVVSWIGLDDGSLFADGGVRLSAFRACGITQLVGEYLLCAWNVKIDKRLLTGVTTGFGLQLAMVLKWLPVTQQCLHYKPIWNKLVIILSTIICLICLVFILMSAALVGSALQIEQYVRFGVTVWGGYSSLLSLLVAATVAAMVVRTKRNVVRVMGRFDEDQERTVRWMGRVVKVMIGGSVVVAVVVILLCIMFATAGHSTYNRLAVAITKFGGCIVQSWLLFIIFTIRNVSSIRKRYASGSVFSSSPLPTHSYPVKPFESFPMSSSHSSSVPSSLPKFVLR
ncbi:hypothetical protein HK104_004251 [Borealophlyctis nickersoniae]|nr:hypothetical protein HK104_004251 [Borealophlyctis nickersoniae]